MEISFTPSPDVTVVLNALLDIYERRTTQAAKSSTEHATRAIKLNLIDISLPSYFSQTDPTPRILANEQFIALERAGLLRLGWIPGETGHLLQFAMLPSPFGRGVGGEGTEHATYNPVAERMGRIYQILNRTALTTNRTRLESLLLADRFRFVDDWRARALRLVLANLRAGKSPSPFNLTDSDLTLDLLTVMEALPFLATETPYRVFSVRIFNDSKRFEAIKNQLVSLARLGNPEWKRISAEEVLRELNLVPNPNYLHLAGNWQFTLETGEILSLGGFYPSFGFPAAQTASLQSVEIHADVVLSIENLTTFHEFVRKNGARNTQHIIQSEVEWAQEPPQNMELAPTVACSVFRYATICTLGNPSPAVRRLLRLIPDSTPIYHWSDLDYGGFNILSQLRRLVNNHIQPYLMDIATLDANYERSRPLSVSDRANLKKLLIRPELRDVCPVIEHLLKHGVKLEQEGVESG